MLPFEDRDFKATRKSLNITLVISLFLANSQIQVSNVDLMIVDIHIENQSEIFGGFQFIICYLCIVFFVRSINDSRTALISARRAADDPLTPTPARAEFLFTATRRFNRHTKSKVIFYWFISAANFIATYIVPYVIAIFAITALNRAIK